MSLSQEKQWQWILMNALNEFKLCFYKGLKSGATNWKEDSWYFKLLWTPLRNLEPIVYCPAKYNFEWMSGFFKIIKILEKMCNKDAN